MEWSNSLTLEFIQLYESHPVLWDAQHKNHKSRTSLLDAWQSIAQQLSVEVTVDSLRKKKESLMSTYRILAKKVRNSETNGSGNGDVYTPTWFAFDALDRFIRGKNERLPSLSFEQCDGNYDNLMPEDDEMAECDVPDVIIKENHENGEYLEENGQYLEENRPRERLLQQHAPRKRARSSGDRESNVEKHLKHASDMLANIAPRHTEPEQDSISLYCQLLAAKLRRLPKRSQLVLQNQIDNLVFQAELNEMDSRTCGNPDVKPNISIISNQF